MRVLMNPYERDYFISRLRSGFYRISDGDTKLKIISPTIEQEYEAQEVFMDSYDRCVADGFLTEDEVEDWMIERGLWSTEKEQKLKTAEEDADKLRVEIFEQRNKEATRERARSLLRAAEKFAKELKREKDEYFSNTCEGIAYTDKSMAIFEWCCIKDGEPYDFPNDNASNLYYQWVSQLLRTSQIRELARNDPWSSLWALKDQLRLFANKDTELTIDQKNIVIWSQMYDNIQESMDCPSRKVIDDDDMLDGWMILQKKKNESERAKSELETKMTNQKIANSQEIFIVTDNREDANNINNMNSLGSQMVKKERMATIKRQGGEAKDLDFRDQQLKVSNIQKEQFKGKFGGR